jgi:hypothetical protein
MIEAFSNARDVCVVSFEVNASCLIRSKGRMRWLQQGVCDSTGCLPRECDLDLREAKLKKLQLAEVLVEEIAACSVAPGTTNRILPVSLKGCAFRTIRIRILTIRM